MKYEENCWNCVEKGIIFFPFFQVLFERTSDKLLFKAIIFKKEMCEMKNVCNLRKIYYKLDSTRTQTKDGEPFHERGPKIY